MRQQFSVPTLDQPAEISALIETLLQTEQRLAELTAGEVDTVSDHQGRTVMLRHAQTALRDSETFKQAAILDALPAMIALLNAQGDIVAVNASWRSFGAANGLLSRDNCVGDNYLDAYDVNSGDDASEASQVAAGIRSVLSGRSQRFSIEYPCHSPIVQRWFLLTVTPLSEERANGAVVMHLDLTAERLAAKSMAESDLRFRQMADHITDVFFLQSLDSTEIYYVSPAFEHIWGRSCASLYANPVSWTETIHPDDRHYALPQTRESGGAGFDYEYRIIRPDGEIRWIQTRGFPILDAAGEPYRTAGVCTDITERRQAADEVRRLNASLEQTVDERTAELQAANKELEAFDYSVSHDLRAPIRHVEGFGALLMEQYGDKLDAQGRDYLQRIRDAGSRMEQLVGDLLALSLISRCDLHRTKVDMSALVLVVLDELQKTEPERQIECVVMPGLSANVDRGQLQIVLENLLGNAWKFTGKRSGAKIEVGCHGTDAEPVFYVRDNGAGFDADYASRLFAPFQRLHKQSEFKGTGIGLATVRRIITRHGGKVWAEGSVDKGATFRFTLPL